MILLYFNDHAQLTFMRKVLIFMREFALITAKSLKWMVEFPPATLGACANGHWPIETGWWKIGRR
ncbi:MAG TPA: hypothetical protein VFE11_05545 [Dongiaceae bacterium]|nr:hypothetical protein [Dongiaceae bacterium]